MSGKQGCACCSKGGTGRVVLVLLCLAGAALVVYVAAVVLIGVFSWHGLTYSFGLAAAGPLRFAVAVRITTFALLIELGTAVSLVLDYRDGRRALHFRWAWAVAHVTLTRRVAVATGWVLVTGVTLAGDVAAYLPIRAISRKIGVTGLCHHVIGRLADVRSACVALMSAAIRRRRSTNVVVAMVTDEKHEVITADVVAARIHDAA